jgi:acyl carrier protein
MNENEHFLKLVNNINQSTNPTLKQKIDKLTNNQFTFRHDCSSKDNSKIDSLPNNLFNQLNKIDKDKFINLNLTSINKIIMSILYSINYNEFNLITNQKEILDNLCTNILIEFNNIFKTKDYKKITSKKKLREIVENSKINEDLFLMVMADYLDFNLLILNNRLVKFLNNIENRATIIIYKDKEDVYNLDSIQEFTIIDDIKEKYSKQFDNYEAMKLKSISNYKLTELQDICSKYEIVINPNKKFKKDVYDILLKFFEF